MMRYEHHTSIKVAKIKKAENTRCWQGYRGTETLSQC